MKTLLITLLTLAMILSCNSTPTKRDWVYATEFNFNIYKGKRVDRIRYCDGCSSSGDLLTIYFTDGTNLEMDIYKYNVKIILR